MNNIYEIRDEFEEKLYELKENLLERNLPSMTETVEEIMELCPIMGADHLFTQLDSYLGLIQVNGNYGFKQLNSEYKHIVQSYRAFVEDLEEHLTNSAKAS